jgi:hypothetical protein
MSRRVCSFRKPNDERCRAAPLTDQEYCFWHSPEHIDEAAEARRLGGLRRRREVTVAGAYGIDGLETVADIRRILMIVAVDTLGLDNSVHRSRVLIALAAAAAKLLETGEMEQRLVALEAAHGQKSLPESVFDAEHHAIDFINDEEAAHDQPETEDG